MPFVTTKKPYGQITQTTVFHFSPLSSTTLSPMIYPTAGIPTVPIFSGTMSMTMPTPTPSPALGFTIFKPTNQPQSGGVQIIQPIPGPTSTAGPLISQTVQMPLATSSPSQVISCGVNRGTTNRVVGGNEAKKGTKLSVLFKINLYV